MQIASQALNFNRHHPKGNIMSYDTTGPVKVNETKSLLLLILLVTAVPVALAVAASAIEISGVSVVTKRAASEATRTGLTR